MAQVKACCLTAPSHYLNHVDLKTVKLFGIHSITVISLRCQWVNAESYCHFSQVTEDGQNTILLQMEDDGETMEVVQQPQIIDDSPRRTRGRPTKQHQIQLQFEVGGGRSQTWEAWTKLLTFCIQCFSIEYSWMKSFQIGLTFLWNMFLGA